MLERIREGSQGPWAMIVIALIVLSFVFAGVSSYLFTSGSNAAAVVNGEEISLQELERSYQNKRAQMEAQFGEGVSSLFSNEDYLREFKRSVLEGLIGDKLVEQQARKIGLRVSNQQVRDAILDIPAFQLDGKFDNDRFENVLRQNGFLPENFSDYLRVQMTKEQLSRALTGSEFVLDAEVNLAGELQNQTRNAQYMIVESQSFVKDLNISEDDINAYYQENMTRYDTEELVKLAYVELTVDSLKDKVVVDDDEISTFYEDNKAIYTTQEERRVSHILIEVGDDQSAANKKAEDILARLKGGEDFAELAKSVSDDIFTAENGGDLEFITTGVMDASFDESAFALANVGDLSEVVLTDFGYHIIKLTDIREQSVTPLSEVSANIKEQLSTEKATDLFFEQQNTMSELAFEVSDSLEDVAAAIEVEVKETPMFSRKDVPTTVNTQGIIDVAFSTALIEDELNSELIEDGAERVLIARVIDHEPSRTKSLDEVKDDVESRLKAEKSQIAAEAWAMVLVEQINQGEDVSEKLIEKQVSWMSQDNVARNSSELPRSLVNLLFGLGLDSGDNIAVDEVSGGDVGIVKLVSVNETKPLEETELESLRQQLFSLKSSNVYESYIASLREDADITFKNL